MESTPCQDYPCQVVYNQDVDRNPVEYERSKMKLAVLGLGVIGTTYAYALQQAGCDTYHIVREGKKRGLELPMFYGNMEKISPELMGI